MDTRQAYNTWAAQYDTNHNRTRDLEAIALKQALGDKKFTCTLEIGCGTGKNTLWLQDHCEEIVAVDLSEEMLAKAKEKVISGKVMFIRADILQEWTFATGKFDLVTFSLVLEHIENIDNIIAKAAVVLQPGGYVYIGELHPFKQYNGTKARFETGNGVQVVTCYNHHVSDFTAAAKANGLAIETIEEWFDDDDRSGMPRILGMLLRKN